MFGLPTRRKSTSSSAGCPRQEHHRDGRPRDGPVEPKKRQGHMPRLSLKFGPSRSPPLSFPAGLGEYFFPERRTSKPPARNIHSPTPSCPEAQIDARRVPVRRSSVSSTNMLDWMPTSGSHRAARSESSRYGRDSEPPPQYPGPPTRTTSVKSPSVPAYHSTINHSPTTDTAYPSFLPPIQARTSSLYHCRSHASRKSQHSLDEIMMGRNRPVLRPSRSNSSPWNLESTPDSPACEAAKTSTPRPATSAGLQTSSRETIRPSSSVKPADPSGIQPSGSRHVSRDSPDPRLSRASTSGSSSWDSATCRDSLATDGLRYSLSSAVSDATFGMGTVMPIPESPNIPAFPMPPTSVRGRDSPSLTRAQNASEEPKRRSLAQRRKMPGGFPKKLDAPQYRPPPPNGHRHSQDNGMTSMDSPVLGWFPSSKPIRSTSCPPRPDDVNGKGKLLRPIGLEPDPSPSWVVSPKTPVWATSPVMVVASIAPDVEVRSPWVMSPVMTVAQVEPDEDEEGREVCDAVVGAGPPAVPVRSPQRAASPV